MEIVEHVLNKKDKKWLKLMELGNRIGCHQKRERSFIYKGYQFPVCARCTGVIMGYFCLPVFILIPKKFRIVLALVCCAIMFLDWLIQYLKIKESNNIRRLITGVLGGVGSAYIYAYILVKLTLLAVSLV